MITNSDYHLIEATAFLALSGFRGIGFETLKAVADAKVPFFSFFDPNYARTNALESLTVRFPRLGDVTACSNQEKAIELDRGKRNLEFLHDLGISVIFRDQDLFPKRLKHLKDVPNWIFLEGNVEALEVPAITAVGSRKTTADGLWLAEYLGYCLPELHAATVSGLADGIDQAVHKATISAQLPTIAVLGTGMLSEYPKGSQGLRKEIVGTGGAVITEYLPTDTFSAKNFVRRNRLQAALGHLVIPVEWAAKSGTAHTVKFAYELKRPLAFLRTPHQDSFDWVPGEYRQVGSFFTLPLEHQGLMETALETLSGRNEQLSLI